MKYNLTLILTILLFHLSLGQELKKGGYKTFEEFKNSTPSVDFQFLIQRRTQGDIVMNGGNDYKISSENEQFSRKVLKKEMWGISDGDTLYINGRVTTGLNWYSRVEVLGRYSYLIAAFPINPVIQDDLGLDRETIGYMFGAIGGAIQGARIAKMRVSLLMNMETGTLILLNKDNMIKFLNQYPNIKEQYEQEKDKDTHETWMNYTRKINEALTN
jgi:hypothetical protein